MADVKVNIGVETGNTVNNLGQVNNVLDQMYEKFEKCSKAGDIQNSALLSKQIFDLEKLKGELERRQTQGQSQNQGSFTRMINQGTSTLGNLMGGNIGGAAQGLASLVTGIGKFAGIGAIVGGGLMLANKASESYENSLDTIQGLGRAYNKNVLEPTEAEKREMKAQNTPFNAKEHYSQNNAIAMDFYKSMTNSATRVGMAIDDFAEAVTDMAKNGVDNIREARNLTERAGEFKQATGADLNVLTSFAGLTKRYGNENNALDTAYRGLTASGMNRNQYQEYLQAVQGIIENGIENGFIVSTEDVTKTLAMLAKTAGDDKEAKLWQGQQGANRLAKINSGFSSATELQSTSDVLMYQAVANTMSEADREDYTNVMMKMERGLADSNVAKSYAEVLNQQYGDNEAGKIEELRKAFSLSYNDSDTLLGILEKLQKGEYTEEQFQAEAKDLTSIETPQEKQLGVLNNLHEKTVQMGQNVFEIKYLLGNYLIKDYSDELKGLGYSQEQQYEYKNARDEGKDKAEAKIEAGDVNGVEEFLNAKSKKTRYNYGKNFQYKDFTMDKWSALDSVDNANNMMLKLYQNYQKDGGMDSYETYMDNFLNDQMKNNKKLEKFYDKDSKEYNMSAEERWQQIGVIFAQAMFEKLNGITAKIEES